MEDNKKGEKLECQSEKEEKEDVKFIKHLERRIIL
jgi:hypothetical protein